MMSHSQNYSRLTAFSYKGLDEIEERLLRQAKHIHYVALLDRTERSDNENLGRFDFEPRMIDQWSENPEGPPDDEDSPFNVGDEDEDEPAGLPLGDEPDVDRPPERDEQVDRERAVASCIRWMRQTAADNTVGEPQRRIRVKVYGPKGVNLIFSAQFVCVNEPETDAQAEREAFVPPKMPGYGEDPHGLDRERGLPHAVLPQHDRAWRALGDGYAQFSTILLAGVGQLMGMQNNTNNRLSTQNVDLQRTVERLVSDLLVARFEGAKLNQSATQEERQEAQRVKLATESIDKIGELLKVAVAAKMGIPAELTGAVALLGQSEPLKKALQNPDVLKMMEDPNSLAELAQLLENTSAMARQMREAAEAEAKATAAKKAAEDAMRQSAEDAASKSPSTPPAAQ